MNQLGDILSKKSGSLPHSGLPTPPPPSSEASVRPMDPSYAFDTPEPIPPVKNTTLNTAPHEPADSVFFTPSDTPAITASIPAPSLDPLPSVQEVPSAMPPLDVQSIKAMIHGMKDQLDAMLRMLDGQIVSSIKASVHPKTAVLETGEKVIEGVFNGNAMIGEDGKEYAVPPNYASKSKMVEGDLLKLTVTNKGSYIYKQIGPIERKRLIGELAKDPSNPEQWIVVANAKPFKVLGASVTFYKGESGDEVVLLVPQNGMSEWGAVDNVMKK